MDALLAKYGIPSEDANDAPHCFINNTRNLKTEPAQDDSCGSSDIDQADWDAIKEVEDDLSREAQEDDDSLDEETENKMIGALESISRELFQTKKSNKSSLGSLNSLSRGSTTARSSTNFESFYTKTCKDFLQTRDERLSKQRKQKEEEENKLITYKPNLVSKPAQKKHIPLLDKAKAIEIKKAQALEKAKREREEHEQKELDNLTFKPSINDISKALMSYSNKEEVVERLYQGKGSSKQEKKSNEDETEKLFRPNINKKSQNLAKNIIEKTSSKVEDRLLLQASATQAKKAKLVENSIPKFTPKLNKHTRKIVEQFSNREHNYTPSNNEDALQSLENFSDLKIPLKRLNDTFGDSYSSIAPQTDRSTAKRARMDESTQNTMFVRTLQFDDNLIGNLQQLTMLLQADDNRPHSARVGV